ncbi:MAG: hypothetical protein VKQ33_04675 [Candidatus Sericytochromatia bacterium]|nr:hypothetical protein [Candidatus Sericytochromatia bacterium]
MPQLYVRGTRLIAWTTCLALVAGCSVAPGAVGPSAVARGVPKARSSKPAAPMAGAALATGPGVPAAPAASGTNPADGGSPPVEADAALPAVRTLLDALQVPGQPTEQVAQVRQVGTELALSSSVEGLLVEAEWLAGNGLIGLDASGLIGLDASGLVGLDANGLIGLDASGLIGLDASGLIGLDASGLVGDGTLRYRLATLEEASPPGVDVRAAWAVLAPELRAQRLKAHVQREARVFEAIKAGLAGRVAAFSRPEEPAIETLADGGRRITSTLVVEDGEITVVRETDAAGIPLRLVQRFQGVLDGQRVEAERVRSILADGSAEVGAETVLGEGDARARVTVAKQVGPDGTVTGAGEIASAGGLTVAFNAGGNVTGFERTEARVHGLAVGIQRLAGRSEASVSVEGGQGQAQIVRVNARWARETPVPASSAGKNASPGQAKPNTGNANKGNGNANAGNGNPGNGNANNGNANANNGNGNANNGNGNANNGNGNANNGNGNANPGNGNANPGNANENPGNGNANNGNASAGNGNANAGNGNASANNGNASANNGNANAGNGNASAGNGNASAGNGNASANNASANNANAGNGNASANNAHAGNGNANAGNGNGNDKQGGRP